MLKKGSMIWVKKILGTIIGLAGAGIIFGIDIINKYVADYNIVFGIVLLILSYFLVISGRQL